jgi:hypothetical protein
MSNRSRWRELGEVMALKTLMRIPLVRYEVRGVVRDRMNGMTVFLSRHLAADQIRQEITRES